MELVAVRCLSFSFSFDYQLQLKTERSEKVLVKLNSEWGPADPTLDQELLTEEERQTLRKIGLKMDQTLLLGMDKHVSTRNHYNGPEPLQIASVLLSAEVPFQ